LCLTGIMRILVTGASPGGIGGGICRRLSRDATHLVLSTTGTRGPGIPALRDFRAELEGLCSEVSYVPGDLMSAYFPEILVEEAVRFCGGKLDLVVSCAGRSQRGSLNELKPAYWDNAFAVHVKAPWLLAKAAYPYLRVSSAGSFIAIGSVAASVPVKDGGAYPVAKAALVKLCQVLAAEWAPKVRVNTVSPGLISTQAKPKPEPGDIPLGRTGTPEDVAEAVAFLAGHPYITGVDLRVDGGWK
jgi:NAD(P)-dependent dehydrogenase (short-subunit alcohol dehydrogenase family)